jgi:hypothetical protein
MFTSKKFAKSAARTSIQHTFNQTANVPGYTETANAFKIFIQSTKDVSNIGGIRQSILLLGSKNPAFTALYGAKFFIVGKSFMAASHKEQLCMIANELMRNGECDQANAILTAVSTHNYSTILARADMADVDLADGVATPNDLADRRVALSGAFGARTAKKVVSTEVRKAMHDSTIDATVVAKAGKVEKTLYNKKTWKPAVKSAKVFNDAAMKGVKTEAKTAKAQAKADARVAKQAAKAAPVDLEQEAADIDVEIVNDMGAEAAAAAC